MHRHVCSWPTCSQVRVRQWISTLLGLMLVTACQSQSFGDEAAAPHLASQAEPATEAKLMEKISTEIGNAPCSNDHQCHTLPLGEKACGGPTSWLPWSSTVANGDLLLRWTSELAALQRQRHASSGILSNCQYLPDPGAMCLANRCVTRSPDLSN